MEAEVTELVAHVTREASKNRQKIIKADGRRLASKFFGKSSKITEWTASELFSIPDCCKRYSSHVKTIRHDIVRIFRHIGIEFHEEADLPSPTNEVSIPHWFSCMKKPEGGRMRCVENITFSIYIIYLERENTHVIRSGFGAGQRAAGQTVIESIEAELKLAPAPFYKIIHSK